jgi:8-oxo-dGTP pyrophosphatase MutT (NUDIX family)
MARKTSADIAHLIAGLTPFNEHEADALAWLKSTDDLPARRKAELWLPTGGHVEVGEDPAETVRREAEEELGVAALLADPGARPLFLTVSPRSAIRTLDTLTPAFGTS